MQLRLKRKSSWLVTPPRSSRRQLLSRINFYWEFFPVAMITDHNIIALLIVDAWAICGYQKVKAWLLLYP